MKKKVLFVCIHNSARSQMAEAFLNQVCGDEFEAHSAGIEPGKLNPVVVEAMQEIGIDISGNKTKAIFRFVGSIAFVGAARTGFCVVHDPDDKNRRLVLPVKTNIGPEAEGLAYTLEQVLAGYYEEDGTKEEVWASRIVWADAPVSISADQAIAAGEVGVTSNPREREPSATEAVTEFLQEILRYGPVEVTDIERDARKAGLLKDGQRANDAKPFRLAKKELQIASKREGFGPDGRFIWMLPEREPIRDY